jgi:hypothetical protein
MNFHRSHTLLSLVVLLLIVSLLEGCASLAYLPGQQTIGTLRIIGPNVWVNETPAIDGQTITNGDHVTTGAASSAYINFLSGGFIQLDENTDPGFKLVWEKTQCIFLILKHRTGQAYQQTTTDDCPSVYETPFGKWIRNDTQFNVQVNQQQTVMTVLEGTMKLVSPQQMSQQQGQQMIVTKSGVHSVKQLTGKELREVTRWRDRFPPPGAGGGSGSSRCGECAD